MLIVFIMAPQLIRGGLGIYEKTSDAADQSANEQGSSDSVDFCRKNLNDIFI